LPKFPGSEKKLSAGLCGIFLGALGVHKFILGYTTQGIIALAASIVGLFVCGGILTIVMILVGIIEGIVYLTKTNEEFVNTYIRAKKKWF
jgi:TM2 domain-containing membrane protein YozV